VTKSLSGALAVEETRVINSVSIETPTGYKVFQLVQGDITVLPTDLLICSSHVDEDRPLDGQIIHRVRDRFGLTLDGARRLLALEHGCWTCFQSAPPRLPFAHVLILRMPEPQPGSAGNALFDAAIRGTFAAVAALEMMDQPFPVISFPVVYGQEISDFVAGAETLIRRATAWLRQSAHTHTVQMVFVDSQDMASWDEAMNRSLGRTYLSGGTSQVLVSLCREVFEQFSTQADPRLEQATTLLREALSRPDRLYVDQVCVFGRKLVEVMLSILLPRLGLRSSGVLINNIEELRKSPRVAPWIISYMHTLRIFGNESVHVREEATYQPARLGISDLVSALSAIRSLLAFWHEFQTALADR
jgi:hypothetical protein